MKIKLVKRANPNKREEEKWYANPIHLGKISLKDLAIEIAGRSSLTRGDVENVLCNFIDAIPKHINDGFSVQLGDLGTMRLSLASEGSLTEEEFNTRKIKPRLVFTAGKDIKNGMKRIHYQRTRKNKPTPLPTKENQSSDD